MQCSIHLPQGNDYPELSTISNFAQPNPEVFLEARLGPE